MLLNIDLIERFPTNQSRMNEILFLCLIHPIEIAAEEPHCLFRMFLKTYLL